MTGVLDDYPMQIVIAGATGRVGRFLTGLLASDPVKVIALTQDPGRAMLPHGVRASAADFEDAPSLRFTMRGADALFLAHGTSASQVRRDRLAREVRLDRPTVRRSPALVDALGRSGALVATDQRGGAAGDGRVNSIDTRDVADVAHVVLLREVFRG